MKKVIRKGNRYVEIKLQPDTETASTKPPENTMMPSPQPKNLGGGWFEVRGQKVQGKEAAEKLIKEGD